MNIQLHILYLCFIHIHNLFISSSWFFSRTLSLSLSPSVLIPLLSRSLSVSLLSYPNIYNIIHLHINDYQKRTTLCKTILSYIFYRQYLPINMIHCLIISQSWGISPYRKTQLFHTKFEIKHVILLEIRDFICWNKHRWFED